MAGSTIEGAENTQNTPSTSAPSWSLVVRGQIESEAGQISDCDCQDQAAGKRIAPTNGIRGSQSPATSISPPSSELAELVLDSDSDVWPALGQAPARARAPTQSASASTSMPTTSFGMQDERPSQRNPQVPRGRNGPNRPFFPRGSQTNGYVDPGRNLQNRPFFPQGSGTNGHVPPRRNVTNKPLFTHNSERNGHIPLGMMNAPYGCFFPPSPRIAHSTDLLYGGPVCRPKGGSGNIEIYNQSACPPRAGHVDMHSTRQPLLPHPVVDGVPNHFYMNGAPMPTHYFPHPMYLDASSGGPYFMPNLLPVPAISQNNSDLRKKIVKQVDYYFSVDNLCKDTYLRQHMDDCGWVAISLVAGFRRMRQLTSDVNLILDALGDSTVVELQGDKISRRNDWFQWPNPHFILGLHKQGHMDSSSSSETASELGTSERVFPERHTPEDVLDPIKR